jgi:YegS/Rv2252/BmrU family lipid kinase
MSETPQRSPHASTPTRCLIIRNPAARRQLKPAQVEAAVNIARQAGWDVTIAVTSGPNDAKRLAREAVEQGIDVIVVNGGDGTINEAINGMAHSESALGVLAGGTANVWAKESRTGKDPVKAMRTIVRGERRRVDLGRAGDRYFLLMAGVGLDAAIIPNVNPALKRRLGAAAYLVAGAVTSFRYRTSRTVMSVDGNEVTQNVYWMLAGNTRSYGGMLNITRHARIDDGRLDVVLMKRGGAWQLALAAIRLVTGRIERSPNVDTFRAAAVDICTAGLPLQLDGEACGHTPTRLESVPGALTVIVPSGFQSPLVKS